MPRLGPAPGVHRARDVAQRLLTDLPERWRHTIAVARQAERVQGTVGSRGEGEVLLAAAWLHDIGYAAPLHDTGFHPIDGARHLEDTGWPPRIAGLVAHHSAALCVAEVRGLAGELGHFAREESPVADALTYADQTAGPDGRVTSVEQRMADMLRRHGPGSPNVAAHARRAPALRAAVQRVEHRLAALGHSSSAA
ncbi:HDIG domain-containing protein [Amorphoplanes nipponensis]|uniref:Metal-dependent phosphohydrolase, HD subdomain protein n=1 Tax=Actinoplanes nipponensis TaxID=135950 RepID=A0A919JCV3_9ACTN|nr:HD domain-containing protein [Actinoplanes nipponensis]GIE47050.1 metal-dependent phosphohydrolase, HD subdomain protein [Actinoplanes nipponensis]